MGGHMLARKIMRTGYFWLTMDMDCCQFVQRCPECQTHGDLIHVLPSELHALTSPWPFSVWGVDIIGKILPKSSSGHEFILVAIDYFIKWVEAASYARLTSVGVASFIRSHIICRYGVPHELISDRGVYFKAEVDTLVQRYDIRHYRSSTYRPQTNGAVEDANKNLKRILRRMVETSWDWSEKAPFCIVGLSNFFSHLYRSHTLLFGVWYGGSVTSWDWDGFIKGSIGTTNSQGRLSSGSIWSTQSPIWEEIEGSRPCSCLPKKDGLCF